MGSEVADIRQKRRFRLQYSLRSLLTLTVIVAIPASCIAHKRYESEKQDRILDGFRACGCIVLKRPDESRSLLALLGPEYRVETVDVGIDYEYDLNLNARMLHRDLPVLRPLEDPRNSARAFELLPCLDRVCRLYVRRAKINEDRAVLIRRVQSIQWLEFHKCKIDDAAFAHLARVKGLKVLVLDRTRISAISIRFLKEAEQLEHIQVGFNGPIARDVIQELKNLKYLKSMDVTECDADDYRALREALPHIELR